MNFLSFLLAATLTVLVSVTTAIPVDTETMPAIAFSDTISDPKDGLLATELDESDEVSEIDNVIHSEAKPEDASLETEADIPSVLSESDIAMMFNPNVRADACVIKVPDLPGISFRHVVCNYYCQIYGHKAGECKALSGATKCVCSS